MPFNLAIFKTRSLTAIVFAIVMLAGLLLNDWSFVILFTIVHFGCWYEFIKLTRKILPGKYLYCIPIGLLYITLPIFLMLYLRFAFFTPARDNYNKIIPCAIIFSIWINDTMAYIVGSLAGKTPFSKISPKKTWEGTAGGAALCIAVIALISWWCAYDEMIFITIAIICSVFGTLGDLLESKLKRMANVKDSGNIMPGHGGFLDRFDSFLAATPFVWLYLWFFMK